MKCTTHGRFERTIRGCVGISMHVHTTSHDSRDGPSVVPVVPTSSRGSSRPCPVTRRLSIPSMASSIAMRACPAPCHATRAGRHAGASRRPTSSASSVSVVARAVNAGETSGKATEDGKPVPPALTSEVRVDATEAVTRYARVDDASVRGRGGGGRVPSHSRGGLARA